MTRAVALGSSNFADTWRVNGVPVVGFEGVTADEIVRVLRPDPALILGQHKLHLRELLMLVVDQRDRALERSAELERELRAQRMMIALQGAEPRDARLPITGGAPIAPSADDPTAAPQGGTDTAPAPEDAAGPHDPAGAPLPAPRVVVNVVLNAELSGASDLESMLRAIERCGAARGRVP